MCIQVEPYIGNIDRDKLYALLTAMKRDRDTIRNLAALHSISVQVLRKRIRAAGIAPVGKGGPNGMGIASFWFENGKWTMSDYKDENEEK